MSAAQEFLASVEALNLDQLAFEASCLMDLMIRETDIAQRGALAEKLSALDDFASVKFPGRWIRARRAAA